MDTEGKKRFPLIEAYAFAGENALSSQAQMIRDTDVEWGRSYESTVRRGYMIRLFQDHGLMPRFVATHWPYGTTTAGETERRRCLRVADDYDAYLAGNGSDEVSPTTVEAASLEFALEAHLRDFLAKNLGQIEPGLHLYEADGRSGVEFSIDGGRIDILAVDTTNRFVVIELKLSQGRNKALGQLLYYMGWVDQHLGNGPSRGIIIASDIAEELAIAVSRVAGVTLYRYRMNFVVEKAGGDRN
jgi:hypothetical protein